MIDHKKKPVCRWYKLVIDPTTLSFLFFSLLLFLAAQTGFARDFTCDENRLIKVTAANTETVEDICSASQRAINFLARYDLHLESPITIRIVDGAINSNGYIAFGSYDRQQDEIRLMSYDAIMKSPSPQMYDQPFDLEHYQGAIAHEIVHAIFYHNSAQVEDQLTNATQEYLAHATQLGVLDQTRRQRIIDEADVGRWESGDSISEIYMALNPTGFAVKSYLHLTQLENPEPFIKMLLKHSWFYVSVP